MSIRFGPGIRVGNGIDIRALPNIITDGLQLYLDAQSYVGSGSTWTSDLGSDATLYNSPTYTEAAPTYFDFDPDSLQYASVPTLGDLGAWTVEAWFRPTADLSTTGLTSVVTTTFQEDPYFYGAINFCLTNYTGAATTVVNGIQVGFYNGAWHTTTPLLTTPGTWYSIIGTYDGVDLKQYNNGEYSNTLTVGSASTANGGPVKIARRWDAPLESAYMFPGDVAIVRIYNIAFDAEQVTQNFVATRGRFGL